MTPRLIIESGIGLETLLRVIVAFIRSNVSKPKYFVSVWCVLVAAGLGYGSFEIIAIGQTHLRRRDMGKYDAMVDAAKGLENQGYPYRIGPKYGKYIKRRQAWLGVYGFSPYCTHWKAVGPTAEYHTCVGLGNPKKYRDLYALAGIRYFSTNLEQSDSFLKMKRKDKDLLYERLPNGNDRNGKSNEWHYLLDSGYDHFLRPMQGKAVVVVCSNEQWIWLLKEWKSKYRNVLKEPTTPIPMRINAGELSSNMYLLENSEAMFYFNSEKLMDDRETLVNFEQGGGIIISPNNLDDIETKIIPKGKRIWELLPSTMRRQKGTKKTKVLREEENRLFEIVQIKMINNGRRSNQHFVFDVDTQEPIIAILPMEAVPGWQAFLNGKPISLYPSALDMLGVFLPPGAHRLSFHWIMPKKDVIAIWISLGTLLLVTGIWIFGAPLRRKRKRI